MKVFVWGEGPALSLKRWENEDGYFESSEEADDAAVEHGFPPSGEFEGDMWAVEGEIPDDDEDIFHHAVSFDSGVVGWAPA